MLSEKQTETYFKQAVEELYKNDGYLFDPDHGLHEQTVSHRLAVYLERRFLKNKTFRTCNLSVDCEYNRNRDDCKKLYGPCMDCRESCRIKELKTPFVYDRRSYSDARDFVRSYPEGKPCRPDIIIHQRGENHPTNILIVEVKKNSNRENGHKTVDLIKLSAFTCRKGDSEYQYQSGFYFEYGQTAAAAVRFESGEIVKELRFNVPNRTWEDLTPAL